MIPPRYPDEDRPSRIRKLLALEISRIVEDLEVRRDFLMEVWSRHRKREPFLDAVYSRWTTMGFPMLAELSTEEVVIVDSFYREVDEFRLYMSFTQDMPTTLGDRYDALLNRLMAVGARAVDALGGAPERPLVDIEEETKTLTPSTEILPREPPSSDGAMGLVGAGGDRVSAESQASLGNHGERIVDRSRTS